MNRNVTTKVSKNLNILFYPTDQGRAGLFVREDKFLIDEGSCDHSKRNHVRQKRSRGPFTGENYVLYKFLIIKQLFYLH